MADIMADETTRAKRWHGRPALAWATRIAIFVVPFLAAMTVAFFLSSQLPVASSLTTQVVRWLAIVAVSTVAMMGVDRLARRLLPLSVLLKLTLVFPDHAPSRFGVAMRTGTTAQLRKRLETARQAPAGETEQEAAERLLELVGLLSHHDRLTRGHSERVRAYSHLIGEELGLSEDALDKLRWAALLHDVGKTAIDTAILNKPGRLTNDEFDTIKTHPDEGRALVAPLAAWLGDSVQAVWQHHERFDGGGYPQGLRGGEISFAARVVTVADSYDVMTSARSYKKPMSAEAARAELADCSGSQFDPSIVRAFLNVSLGRLRLMTGPVAWFAQLALFEPAGVVHASASTAQSGGSGAAGGSAGFAGSAASSTGVTTAASAVPTAVAATTSAGAASTVAATAASVVAATVGIAAASPISIAPVAAASAPVTVATQAEQADLPAPRDTVWVLDDGSFRASELDQDRAPTDAASASAVAGDSAASSVSTTSPSTPVPAAGADGSSVSTDSVGRGSGSPTATTDGPSGVTSTTVPRSSTSSATPTTTSQPSASSDTPTTDAPASTSSSTTPGPTTTTTTTTTTATPTTTTSTTTTTTPPGDRQAGSQTLYLGSGVVGDIIAPAFHGVTAIAPPDIALPNFDTDRDAAPGALVQKDAAGINGTDLTKLLRFKGAMIAPYVIDDDLHVELYVAAKDFAKQDVEVEVGLYRCNIVDQCTLLGTDTRDVKNAKQWKKTKFFFDDIDATIGIGESIEVRVAVLDGSDTDGWFAFGTDQFDASVTIKDD